MFLVPVNQNGSTCRSFDRKIFRKWLCEYQPNNLNQLSNPSLRNLKSYQILKFQNSEFEKLTTRTKKSKNLAIVSQTCTFN